MTIVALVISLFSPFTSPRDNTGYIVLLLANRGQDCAFNNKSRRHALVKNALMHIINGIIAKEKPPGMERVKPVEPQAAAH